MEQARDQIIKILTSEWLVTDVETSGGMYSTDIHSDRHVTNFIHIQGDRRRRELIRIRQIYIPELIIRLHSLLFNSRQRIPECVTCLVYPFLILTHLHFLTRNLKRALDLANTVADSRYKLYEDFVNEDGRRLGDYLGAVRQAILGGLEGGGSDPFRVISMS